MVEGKRIITDALNSGLNPRAVFVTHESYMEELEPHKKRLLESSHIYRVASKDLNTWSTLKTPPGIMAIFDLPQEIAPPKNCNPITVICDNIREPNNLGSIIRVAAALPCSQVMVMKGSSDPWDSKCIRGGSGGQFHIPIEYPVLWEDLNSLVAIASQVVLADTKSTYKGIPCQSIDDQLIKNLSRNQKIFVVIGGETHGVSTEAYE